MSADFAITERIESSLQWIEEFPFDARWEWLNSSRATWRQAGERWFVSWLIGIDSLSRAWINGRMSAEQEERFKTIIRAHGQTIGDLHKLAFIVHPAILDAVLRCNAEKKE
jgi:hypothetical protein